MSEVLEAPPSPPSIPEAVNPIMDAAKGAGVREGDPDWILLHALSVFERRLDADKTPQEQVRITLTRTATQAMERAARVVVMTERRRSWAAVAAAVTLALGVGAAGGFTGGYAVARQRSGWAAAELRAAFSSGTEGATFLATLARNNDLSAMARDCRTTEYRPSIGGLACTIRPWRELPKPVK